MHEGDGPLGRRTMRGAVPRPARGDVSVDDLGAGVVTPVALA
jgi:hypothetical protein